MTNRVLMGQNALILGGAGAIGTATAAALLQDGAHVTLMDISESNLDAAVNRLKPYAQAGSSAIDIHVGDATDEMCIQQAVNAAAGKDEQLDIAVAVIGGGPPGVTPKPLVFLSKDEFEGTLNYNVTPAFLMMKHAAQLMLKKGRGNIAVISSVAAILPAPLLGGYSIGKAALDMLVRCGADELGRGGIRLNAVRPGFTRTLDSDGSFADTAYVNTYLNEQPLKRAGDPQDIAAMVRFLVGPESSWITGQCINVDGGLSLHRIPKREAVLFGDSIPEEWREFLG